jgi:endosialidase-like protein
LNITAGGASRLRVQSNGNTDVTGNLNVSNKLSTASAGIGTPNPATTLDVRGYLTLDPGADPALFTAASGGEHNRYLDLFNSPDLPSASGLKAGGVLVSGEYNYANPGKNDMVVKGNVTIGAPSSDGTARLDVTGNETGIESQAGSFGVNGHGGIVGVGGFTDGGYGVNGFTVHGVGVHGSGSASGSMAVQGVTGTSYFSGDTTPLNASAGKGVAVGFNSGNFGYVFAFDYSLLQPQTLALNSPGGNVGIGTATPDRTLTVHGRAKVDTIPVEVSIGHVCFNAAGDILSCGASSLRLKTNVQPYLSGLSIIRELRPISFNWKEDGRPDIGLGAEDVAEVAPSLTLTDSDGQIAGVKYEQLNLLLINAVKEQQAQIEQLKKLVCLDHPDAEVCK